MKIIRATRDIHVPHNPENPDTNSFKAVQRGLLALVPEDFNLPSDSFIDLGNVLIGDDKVSKKKK